MERAPLTLADVRAWTPPADAPPVRLGVIGDPVAHSLSPRMHQAALDHAGIAERYAAIHLRPDEFAEGIGLLRDRGFRGANVTIPHKAAALALCDELSGGARALGAVNTVLFDDGRTRGFNTDGPGFVRAVREAFGVDLRDLRVLVLGAGGGAGRALASQCALAQCPRIALVNRDPARTLALAKELDARHYAADTRLLGPTARVVAAPWDERALAFELEHTDLVVHCTPLGMKLSDPPALPARLLAAHLLVFDTVYRADRPPRLVETAREAGARAADGRALLLHQGALAWELWFDRPAPLEVMRKALMPGEAAD